MVDAPDPSSGAFAPSAVCTWPHSPANDPRPLAGVKVLDISRIVAGPLCAMTLADLGADVVKVEAPSGDEVRRWGPPFRGETSTYYLTANRNKWSVSLDLKSETGRAALTALAAQADVVVSNFTGAVALALGADFESMAAVNPSVIHLTISGYGPQQPDRPGFDLVAQAVSGLMSVTGPADGQAAKVGIPIADITAAHYATIAVLAQLVRSRPDHAAGPAVDHGPSVPSRRAVRLEVSLQDATVSLLANQAAGWLLAGSVPVRRGNDHPNVAPYGVFSTADGAIAIGAGTDAQFVRLCAAVGRSDIADDPRFIDNSERVAHVIELTGIIERALAARSTASWSELLDSCSVPNGPIRDVPEALAAVDAELIPQIESGYGPLSMLATPIRTDGAFPSHYLPPPELGQHTDRVIAPANTGQL